MGSFAEKIILGSKVAFWFKRCAIFSVLVIPVAIVGFRLNLLSFPVAYKMMGVSLLLSVAVFLLTSLSTLTQRQTDRQVMSATQFALYISLIPLLFLGMQIFTAKSLPMIHNISTDLMNPPQFEKIATLRGAGTNSLSYDKTVLADLQKQAYPDIATFVTEENFEIVFKKASAVVGMLGWELVNKDSQAGIIEATETTGLWGFKDDVVIRINRDNVNILLDVRSVSRIGKSDLGTNAKRIKRFFSAYQSL